MLRQKVQQQMMLQQNVQQQMVLYSVRTLQTRLIFLSLKLYVAILLFVSTLRERAAAALLLLLCCCCSAAAALLLLLRCCCSAAAAAVVLVLLLPLGIRMLMQHIVSLEQQQSCPSLWLQRRLLLLLRLLPLR